MQKGLATILIVLILAGAIALATGAYYLGTRRSETLQERVDKQNPNFSPTTKPTPTNVDETANWKTYTNIKYGYLIKYPSEIRLVSSNEDAVELYRENVNIGAGMGERGHGMIIYYRNFGAETIESQTRPTENISISSYPALRWTDNNLCMEDIWLPNPNKENTLRISFITCAEKDPYKKIDFDLFNKILSTFKFQ